MSFIVSNSYPNMKTNLTKEMFNTNKLPFYC